MRPKTKDDVLDSFTIFTSINGILYDRLSLEELEELKKIIHEFFRLNPNWLNPKVRVSLISVGDGHNRPMLELIEGTLADSTISHNKMWVELEEYSNQELDELRDLAITNLDVSLELIHLDFKGKVE